MQTSHLLVANLSSVQSFAVQAIVRSGQANLTIGWALASNSLPNIPIKLSELLVIVRVFTTLYA